MRHALAVLLLAGAARAEPALPDLNAALQRAKTRLHAVLGKDIAVPGAVIRWRKVGKDSDGTRAWSRTDGDVVAIELAREYAALGALDIDTTVVHELFHAVHRNALGSRYARSPVWAREGAAQYVAGQGALRARLLAVHVVREKVADPLARLVDGLAGRHDFLDYYEDVAAFEALGEADARRLIRALLKEPDPKRAVHAALGISFAEFERRGRARARKVLGAHIAALREGPSPAYPDSYLPRVRALRKAGKSEEALALLRSRVLKDRTRLLAVGEAVVLELVLLKELRDPLFPAVWKRTRPHLAPFDVDLALLKIR